jgi:hypothetical protein
VTTITGDVASLAQALTINATDDLSTVAISNIEKLIYSNALGGAIIAVTIDEDNFASFNDFQGSTNDNDTLVLNGNAATDDFDFTSSTTGSAKLLANIETLTLTQADQVTVNSLNLDDITTINGAGTGDLNIEDSTDITPITFNLTGAYDLVMTTNDTTLTIDDVADSGANGFSQLIGQGSNDLVIGAVAAATVIDNFTGFDTVDMTAMADDDNLTINDAVTGNTYTVTIGDSDLDADGSTSTDAITVGGNVAVATQTINTGSGNDQIALGTGLASTHTINTGAGDDTISMVDELTVADTVDAGAGTDTLNVTNDTAVTDLDTVSNIEVLNITNTGPTSYSLGGDATFNAAFTVNALAALVDVTFNADNETTHTMTYNGNSGVDTVTGTATTTGGDTIDLGDGDDIVNASAGADSITLGAGNDTINLTPDNPNTFPGGIDTITDFVNGAGTGNDLIVINLDNTSYAATANITSITASLNVITSSKTTAEITGDFTAYAIANAVIVVHNSSTNVVEIWFDTDWQNTANRSQVATLSNRTALTDVTSLSLVDAEDFDVN